MKKFTTIIFRISPCLIYSLILAPFYSIVSYSLYKPVFPDTVLNYTQYYIQGLISIFIVFFTLRIVSDKSKHIWQYILPCLLLLVTIFILTHCYVLTALSLLIEILIYAGHQEDEFGNLYKLNHYYVCLGSVASFIITGFLEAPDLQAYSLYSIIISLALIALCNSFLRITTYASNNKNMKDSPLDRMFGNSVKLFTALIIISLIIIIPLVMQNYSFMKFTMPEPSDYNGEYEIVTGTTHGSGNISGGGNNFEDMGLDIDFTAGKFWTVLETISIWLLIIAIPFVIALMIYKTIKNYNKIIIEQKDVIEKSSDDSLFFSAKKNSEKISFFDFSPNAVIRKRYIKKIKRSSLAKPQAWQSPSEIEKEVNLNNQELHELYEKARYSENGCSKNEI